LLSISLSSQALLLEDATIPTTQQQLHATRRALHSSSGLWQAAPAAAKAIPKVTPTIQIEEIPPTHSDLTPRQVVELLDRFIVGQSGAKKAVANALRNRWRRHRVPSPLREEIVPKNILMIGPTGCGKTEIARRLAKLADAPFVKVEATKFTEVGFHGRDVDQIIRDLVDNAIIMVKHRTRREQQVAIDRAVEDRLVAALVGEHATAETRAAFRQLYRDGELEDREVEVEVPSSPQRMMPLGGAGGDTNIQEMVIRVDRLFRGGKGGGGEGKRKLKISEARPLVEEVEAERFINSEAITREAVAATEADGIVFIDEIDKIVTSSEYRYGADASSEGVQRDLLPIIEGSVVSTKHGNVNTDHILFICSGAFHSAKPSDMLAELQGRLPVRVELKGLTQEDFYKILTEPEANMITQQQALLATENVELIFTDAAIKEISKVAEEVNTSVDNIGARRLHTIIERIVEDISFEAPDKTRDVNGEVGTGGGKVTVVIDKEDVVEKIGDLLKKQDLSKYVL
jgi:ATP-dependent HslUV protease ATP-binding subunit HslU